MYITTSRSSGYSSLKHKMDHFTWTCPPSSVPTAASAEYMVFIEVYYNGFSVINGLYKSFDIQCVRSCFHRHFFSVFFMFLILNKEIMQQKCALLCCEDEEKLRWSRKEQTLKRREKNNFKKKTVILFYVAKLHVWTGHYCPLVDRSLKSPVEYCIFLIWQ